MCACKRQWASRLRFVGTRGKHSADWRIGIYVCTVLLPVWYMNWNRKRNRKEDASCISILDIFRYNIFHILISCSIHVFSIPIIYTYAKTVSSQSEWVCCVDMSLYMWLTLVLMLQSYIQANFLYVYFHSWPIDYRQRIEISGGSEGSAENLKECCEPNHQIRIRWETNTRMMVVEENWADGKRKVNKAVNGFVRGLR